MSKKNPIVVAADGSALGNPGPAGWAWYIDENNWASGGWSHGTNNMGELKAVLDIFHATAHIPERPLQILCDSQYAINCISKWMPGWKKKGWKKADGKPVLNQDLLKELDEAIQGRDFSFEWVKGHAGHPLNEKADDLARAAATAYQEGQGKETGPRFSANDASTRATTLEEDLSSKELSQPESLSLATQNPLQDLSQEANDQENLLFQPAIYSNKNLLSSLLAPEFTWVTPAGLLIDRAGVIEHRERAFASQGESSVLTTQAVSAQTVLVLSQVETMRGRVTRSSLWQEQDSGKLVLVFRQDTAC